MSDPSDIQRIIGDVIREGVVASVDLAARRCTVNIGDMTTSPVPWFAGRAGDTSVWSPVSVGEQGILISPEGDTECGLFLPGTYSDANPAPGDGAKQHIVKHADGALIGYDAEAHQLTATLPDGATATITAPGGMRLVGNVTIEGDLDVTGAVSADDVSAGDISLKDHGHDKVAAGGAKSGKAISL